MKTHRLYFLAALILLLAASACNLPTATQQNTDTVATSVAATLFVLQASASAAPPAPTLGDTLTPTPTDTPYVLPSITSTPQSPLVTGDALCWAGPGPVYEVVSAIKKGTHVELLGRGSISGWWIVRNPIYHDPCWIPDKYLQIDPAFNISALQIYYPPPTPTYTPSATPTP